MRSKVDHSTRVILRVLDRLTMPEKIQALANVRSVVIGRMARKEHPAVAAAMVSPPKGRAN